MSVVYRIKKTTLPISTRDFSKTHREVLTVVENIPSAITKSNPRWIVHFGRISTQSEVRRCRFSH